MAQWRNGRRGRLKIFWAVLPVRVRVPVVLHSLKCLVSADIGNNIKKDYFNCSWDAANAETSAFKITNRKQAFNHMQSLISGL